MLTQKDYCDYDTCVALKELGYDELCDGYYHLTDDEEYEQLSFNWCYGRDFQNSLDRWRVGVPMLYEAQKWLREEKRIEIVVHSLGYVGEPYFADIHMHKEVRCACSYADTYEEALSKGLKCAVKILKEK